MLPGWKGRTRALPEAPEFPEELDYLWDWFHDIMQGSDGGGFAAPRVTWLTLQAWGVITRTVLEPWEADALIRLGCAFAAANNEKPKSGTPTTK